MSYDSLIRDLQGLRSPLIADALDKKEIHNQVMKSRIRPIYPDAVVAGRAFTFLAAEVFEEPKEPWKMEIEAVDSLKPGDVFMGVINERGESAIWGELLTNAAIARGAKGLVVDGHIRDVQSIVELRFPTFCVGFTPADCKGRSKIFEYNVPIKCGGVTVFPNDLILGDYDGVVVIPHKIAEEVICYAKEKSQGEDTVRKELRKGRAVKEVFDEFGIL